MRLKEAPQVGALERLSGVNDGSRLAAVQAAAGTCL